MKQTMEIKKENGEIIKMELVIAGAANLTEMQIVKVNKFNEETNIGYYTVNNDTDEAMLDIYIKQEKDVTKAYGAAKARNGIAYTTATKTSYTMKHYKNAKFMEKALKAYELTLEEVKNVMETLKAATITNNMVDVSEYAVNSEAQEVAIQTEIENAANASEEANEAPFSDEEAALLDRIEKAAADNILLQHGNHEAAHQATLDREAAEAELGKLAMQAHKIGNDKHFKLLFNEMQARIERGTKFGSENEGAAGQYVRGELTYKPFGNRSIVLNDSEDKNQCIGKTFYLCTVTWNNSKNTKDYTDVATIKEAFDIIAASKSDNKEFQIYDYRKDQFIYYRDSYGVEEFYIDKQEVDRDEFSQVYEMGALVKTQGKIDTDSEVMNFDPAVESEEKVANAGNENAVHHAELIERAKRKYYGEYSNNGTNAFKMSILTSWEHDGDGSNPDDWHKIYCIDIDQVYVGTSKPFLATGHSLGISEEDRERFDDKLKVLPEKMLSGRNLADVVEGIEKAAAILGWVDTKGNAGQGIISKPFSACFCTFDGGEDDVTSSFDTESKDFATAQEAYEACRHFINTCDGYLFAGCYIEHWTDSGCKTIFNSTCENWETFYIDGNEVEFSAFNAKYHIYTPKFTAELDELFQDYEEKSYEIYQAEYFQNHKAFDAGIAARSKISNAIWEAKENYTERYGGEISEEITHCTERAQARFDDWKSNYEMIQKMKAEGKGVTEMVAALNGANIDETQNVQAQTDSNSASQNDDPIVMQFAKAALKVSYIDEYFIYKAKEKNRNKEFFKHKKWAEYAEKFNYQLPIIEKRDKNDKPRYYYQPVGNNGLQSVSRANAAMLVADGLAFIKRENGYIIINRESTKSIPQNWIDEMAKADERAAKQDKKDKADYENRIEVTKSNIERTFSENNFTPEQVQAFKAIYNYEFAATVKEYTGSKAINYDELKAQHDAAQQRLRDDSQWAYYAEEFGLFADLRGMITDYSSLGQLEAVYSIYWSDIKATTPSEADVDDNYITSAAQEVAIKAEEEVAFENEILNMIGCTDERIKECAKAFAEPFAKVLDTAANHWITAPDEPEKPKTDETTAPLFYVDNDKPFTVIIDGRIKKDFAGAKEAVEYLQEFNVKNSTTECQIEDADGDMIYEDDKIQIRYYDTEGNEVDYDTFLKIYLALGIKSDCEQSSILTA